MNYSRIERLTAAQIDDLYQLYRGEWWCRDRQRADLEAMLAHSDVTLGFCTESGRLVAFTRLLSDQIYQAILFDVIVHPQHRGQGLGRALIEAALQHPAVVNVETVTLFCRSEMIPFYQKWDFAALRAEIHARRRRRSA
ncbi:MAG: GNAT family N-acetyltransferase [Spirulinaceae cyanobacterium SM2_1_0]|nr:GNAT family N-acetyltransferase [Spirulinaceae cyanobacterium SM2_1_0]